MQAAISKSLLTEQGGTDILDETQGGEIGKRRMEDRQGGRGRQSQGTVAPERREGHQENGASRTKLLPPTPSSGERSSADGKAAAEDPNSGIKEMMSQQAQLERVVLRLIAVVTEEGGAQWEDSPELTERALVDWLGQQEDRAEELRERI